MTSPQPVPKSRRSSTQGRPVKRSNAQRGSSGATVAAGLAPAAFGTATPSLRKPREKILLCGDTTSGKSYAYMRMALKELLKAQTEDRKPSRFFIIDTDDTCPTFMSSGYEFERLYVGNGGNVYPFPCDDWTATVEANNAVLAEAAAGDWIVIDVANRVYEYAQRVVADKRGFDLADTAIGRGMEKKGFGAFEAGDWNVIAMVHDSLIGPLAFSSKANILCLSHVTEVVTERGERREVKVLYDAIGLKPRVQPKLPDKMNTIAFIWSTQHIPMDGTRRKRGAPSRTDRWFAVVKDRGQPYSYKERYDKDFYDKLIEMRESGVMPANVTKDDDLVGLEGIGDPMHRDTHVDVPEAPVAKSTNSTKAKKAK